jgi:hypothetical protein
MKKLGWRVKLVAEFGDNAQCSDGQLIFVLSSNPPAFRKA